jgi:hypothetical protein
MLIDGTPQVKLDALDPDEHLVHMPFVARPGPPTAHSLCKATAKLLAPPPYRLVGDADPALGQKQLNIPQAQAEHVVKPDGMTDEFSREPGAVMGIG